MKKILLATTALVATAGFAAADVAISGSAEMGIKQEAQKTGGDKRSEFHTDISVSFKMSGESDNGISFGAKIGLEEAQDGVATDVEDDFTVFVSAGAAKLTMGDTDGAFDKAMTEVAVGSSIADDHTAHAGYNGNAGLDGAEDGQIARFDYSFSGVTLSISSEIDDDGKTATAASAGSITAAAPLVAATATAVTAFTAPTAASSDTNAAPVNAIGVAYSGDLGGLTLGVGFGYQAQADNAKVTGLSLNTTFSNGLQAILNFSETDYDASGSKNQTHMGIGLGYSMNALTIGLNYGEYTNVGGTSGAKKSGTGLAVNYDLGGGLVAQMGYGSSQYNSKALSSSVTEKSYDSWSLGLGMSF